MLKTLMTQPAALLLVFGLASTGAAQAERPLTGSPVLENFNGLASTGTSGVMPADWSFLETGGATGTVYTATDGAANSGDSYSAGTTGSSERAFGSIGSGTVTRIDVGAIFVNQTGSTIGDLTIAYVGEQWRLGTTGAAGDLLTFQYSLDATSLSTGSWVNVPQLNFASPVATGTANSALDGNAAANRTSISHTISGLSIGVGQTVFIRWFDTNSPGADDLLAIDDVVVSTTGAADFPPTVSSTVPANMSMDAAAGTNVTINFSEPVTTAGNWFTLSCSVSGNNVAGSISGTGATRVFDPTVDLVAGETCMGTVTAALVTDLDGTVDPMASDFGFNFSIAPDNAPTISSTVPSNGQSAVSIAANVLITFSEDVAVSGTWYTIICDNSGNHSAVVSGGPRTYTLNPAVDFAELEMCTVTLNPALVVDLDGTPDTLAGSNSFSFTTAAGVADYYASVDASSAATLRATLHALIDDHVGYPYTVTGPMPCAPAAPLPRDCDTWDVLESADQNPGNPAQILDVYKNAVYTKVGGGNNNYNREHTWPNSRGFNDLNGLDGGGNPYSPYTDTHMLYLSNIGYNSDRGNSPFDSCVGCTERTTDINNGSGGGSGVYPGNSNWFNASTFEPWNVRKGDMARAMMYMDVRYEGGFNTAIVPNQPEPDLILTNNRALIQTTPSGQVPATGYMGILDTLIAWHLLDPPNAQEVLRNEVVYGFQGNRNPFIDHPEWVECLFLDQCTRGPNVFANGFESN